MTFVVVNGGTNKVSELEVRKTNGVILGERENVVGKDNSGTFALRLGPGHYVLACPLPLGGGNGTLVVSGKSIAVHATPGTKLAAAANGYQAYVKRQVAQLRQGTRRFTAALAAGNLAQAKTLFGPTRRHYEAIEPVAESFSGLAAAIDARNTDGAPGTPWPGSPHIEQNLWEKTPTAGTAARAKKLNDSVSTLQGKVATLSYQPAQLANGSVELLNEVATSKITGEEDRYSHTDLSDFQGNLEGARVAVRLLLRPAARRRGQTAALAEHDRRSALRHRADRASTASAAVTRRSASRTTAALTPADSPDVRPGGRRARRAYVDCRRKGERERLMTTRREFIAAAGAGAAAGLAVGRRARRRSSERNGQLRPPVRRRRPLLRTASGGDCHRGPGQALAVRRFRRDRGHEGELRDLLRDWTQAAALMTKGVLIGPVGGNEEAPPEDTGEARWPAARRS